MTHCEREGGTCIDVDFTTGRRVDRAGATEVTGGGGSGGEAEEKEGAPKPRRPAKKAPAPRNMKRRPKLASRTAIRRPAAASRRRRQANPFGIIDYLSKECWNWEFDFGCHGKGNICCY